MNHSFPTRRSSDLAASARAGADGRRRAHRSQPGGAGPSPVLRRRGGLIMYLQHFGLRHPPLGKDGVELWDDGGLGHLGERFNWLLQSPGIGLLTGEPGVGKTAALRHLTRSEEQTSELQSLMRISYAVFCLKKKNLLIYINNYQ